MGPPVRLQPREVPDADLGRLLHSTDPLATGADVFIAHRLRGVLATCEVFGSVAATRVVALRAVRTRPLTPRASHRLACETTR